jgi:hypothetical protein
LRQTIKVKKAKRECLHNKWYDFWHSQEEAVQHQGAPLTSHEQYHAQQSEENLSQLEEKEKRVSFLQLCQSKKDESSRGIGSKSFEYPPWTDSN